MTFYIGNSACVLGSWTDDKICGEGTSLYPNGNRFVGQWLNGKINGNGKKYKL